MRPAGPHRTVSIAAVLLPNARETSWLIDRRPEFMNELHCGASIIGFGGNGCFLLAAVVAVAALLFGALTPRGNCVKEYLLIGYYTHTETHATTLTGER